MTEEHWQQIRQEFHDAIRAPDEERAEIELGWYRESVRRAELARMDRTDRAARRAVVYPRTNDCSTARYKALQMTPEGRAKRDESIVRERKAGIGLRMLGRIHGVHHSRISQIVKRGLG